VKVLVLNCGSSSVKFQFIETSPDIRKRGTERRLCRGQIDRIGRKDSEVRFEAGEEKRRETLPIRDYHAAIEKVLSLLCDPAAGVIRDVSEIEAVGHRIVHGAERFSTSTIIDEEVEAKIRECFELAPLHNPPNLEGYLCMKARLPKVPQVAVFDTGFHQTMEKHAYLYAIPLVLYHEHRIRRYGFHGTSHRYVAHRAGEVMERPWADLKMVTVHLGNGCSMAAVDRGRVVDTSMGMTPLEGLVMGTRSGDIDPAVVLHLVEVLGKTTAQVNQILNKESGLLGLSGVSNDMRTVLEAADRGNEDARTAVAIFCYRVKKYIGAYAAAMNGLDAVVFTAGIGENSPRVRALIAENLDVLGIRLDEKKNAETVGGKESSISSGKTAVLVIPTNEEIIIARDTAACLLER
jgi:acetate kinase